VVTAVYTTPQTHQKHLPRHIQAAIAPQLSRYKQPKRWIQLNHLPRNTQGKINRTEIQVLLQGAL
jgi:O-succinylbenzoic acid--CoA ligase